VSKDWTLLLKGTDISPKVSICPIVVLMYVGVVKCGYVHGIFDGSGDGGKEYNHS
jgi:hypothetical protein